MDKMQLEMLAKELGRNEQEEKLWHKFLLIAFLGATGNNLRETLREPLSGLLQELGETTLGEKLKLVIERVPSFPTNELLPLVLELCGKLTHDREQVIHRLEDMLSELAAPIIRIWSEVLLLPLIGSLDTDRAQAIAERLLERASSTRAKMVVVDVTGVPMIDTAAGGFLIEMFSAVKLLGAEVILTGIKPEIAHTLVKLGVDFRMVAIARDLEDALRKAIAMLEEEKRQRKQIALGHSSSLTREGGEPDDI